MVNRLERSTRAVGRQFMCATSVAMQKTGAELQILVRATAKRAMRDANAAKTTV